MMFPLPAPAPMLSETECEHTYPSQSLPASSAQPPERVNGKLDPRKYPLALVETPSFLQQLDLGVGPSGAAFSSATLPPFQADTSAPLSTRAPRTSSSSRSNVQQSHRKVHGSTFLSSATGSLHRARSSEEEEEVDCITDTADRTMSAVPARKRLKTQHLPRSPEPQNTQMPSPFPSPNMRPIAKPSSDQLGSSVSRSSVHSHAFPASPPNTTIQRHFPRDGLPDPDTELMSGCVSDVQLDVGSGMELSALMSLPSLVEQFGSLPNNLQSHVLFNLLRRSTLPVLQAVNEIIGPALKRDFLSDLPLELAGLICTHLNAQALARSSIVCKKWRRIIDGDGRIWKRRLIEEHLWIGSGSEAKEVEAIERGELNQDPRQRFIKNWLGGVWDMHYNSQLAAKPAARKLQIVHSSPSAPIENPFAMSQKSPLLQKVDLPTSKRPSLLRPPQSRVTPQRPIATAGRRPHYVNPYKVVFQQRFTSRKQWFSAEPERSTVIGHGTAVTTCLQFDRDRIVSASDDADISVYDLRNNGAHTQLRGHTGGVWALEYIGDTLVSGSTDRSIRVWDLKTGRCTHVLMGHISTIRCLQIVEPQNVNPDPNGEPVWEPPYPLIVTGSRDTTMRVWKLPKPGQKEYLPMIPSSPDQDNTNPEANPFHVRMIPGHHHAIRALAAHGRIAVTGSYDKTGRVWDILSGKCLHVLRGHSQRVYSVVYDHVEHRAATGSMDGSVKLYSTTTGECLHSLLGHDSLVGLLGLTPKSLVSAAADSTLKVWDARTGRCKSTLAAHSGAITCFMHDDIKVVSGGDGSLKVWDAKTGRFVRDLLVNCQGVWQVGFQDGFCVVAMLRNGSTEFESKLRC